jgi:hypothetical protein
MSRSWALIEKPPFAATHKLPRIFGEPDGALPSSQEPSTGPYPEPDQSSPYLPSYIAKINLGLQRLGPGSGLFPSGLSHLFVLYALLISSSLT